MIYSFNALRDWIEHNMEMLLAVDRPSNWSKKHRFRKKRKSKSSKKKKRHKKSKKKKRRSSSSSESDITDSSDFSIRF